MNNDHSKRIVIALIISWVFMMILIFALAFLITLAFDQQTKSIHDISQQLEQIKPLQTIQGLQGLQGVQGIQGLQGTAGIQGTQGIQGPQGVQGPKGDAGPQGPQGVPGKTGDQGLPGKSARQLEFDGDGHYRYVGDDEWLPLVKGAF